MQVQPISSSLPTLATPPQNITINQTNNAIIAGNPGSLTIANVADVQNVSGDVTINQTNNIVMIQAYKNIQDMLDLWLDDLLYSTIEDHKPVDIQA